MRFPPRGPASEDQSQQPAARPLTRRLLIRARLARLRRTWPAFLPTPVYHVFDRLCREVAPETYLVGGCVRDLLLGRPVHDFDLATAATPDQVSAAFARVIPTGLDHGTVTVQAAGVPVEVTTFRREGPYLDGRRPSEVSFDADLDADLSRRDFTINAMAIAHPGLPPPPGGGGGPFLRDPNDGLGDLVGRVVRVVGDPGRRFGEDHLRVMRAYRIAAELDFDLDPATGAAVPAAAPDLARVAAERIRLELDRALVSERVGWCLEQMRLGGIIDVILPELSAGVGFAQNQYHAYDVWHHNVLACAFIEPELHLRLAALLHDVGKPPTLSVGEDGRRHFFNHEQVGAELAREILTRLRYDRDTIKRVTHLIAVHMDFHDLPPAASDAAVRRAAARVGRAHIGDFLRLRAADRRASGKAGPASQGTLRLLARLAALERADAALSRADLRIDGNEVMRLTGLAPGPAVGRVLDRLLEAVLEDPDNNDPERLAALARAAASSPPGR